MAASSNFVASTHQGKTIIERPDTDGGVFHLEFVPSEAEKASHIIGLVMGMASFEQVPDHIKNTPFVVRIFKNKTYALERTDSKCSMPFRLSEGDDLIKVIKLGLGICLNEQTHGRAVPVNAIVPENMAGDEPL